MIRLRIDELLEQKGKSLYWLAQEVGAQWNSLYRLKNGTASSIKFELLEDLSNALEVSPCDLIEVVSNNSDAKKKSKAKD